MQRLDVAVLGAVPETLLTGHHALITRWRRKEALRLTRERRPELLAGCSEEDRKLLAEIDREESERKREIES